MIIVLSVVGVLVLGSALGVVVVISGNSAEQARVAHPPLQPHSDPPAAAGLPSARDAVHTVIAAYTVSDAPALRRIRCQGAPGASQLPEQLPPGIGMRLTGAITETGAFAEGPVSATFGGKRRQFVIQVKNEGGRWCYYADRATR